jgi:hypothetical protein
MKESPIAIAPSRRSSQAFQYLMRVHCSQPPRWEPARGCDKTRHSSAIERGIMVSKQKMGRGAASPITTYQLLRGHIIAGRIRVWYARASSLCQRLTTHATREPPAHAEGCRYIRGRITAAPIHGLGSFQFPSPCPASLPWQVAQALEYCARREGYSFVYSLTRAVTSLDG